MKRKSLLKILIIIWIIAIGSVYPLILISHYVSPCDVAINSVLEEYPNQRLIPVGYIEQDSMMVTRVHNRIRSKRHLRVKSISYLILPKDVTVHVKLVEDKMISIEEEGFTLVFYLFAHIALYGILILLIIIIVSPTIKKWKRNKQDSLK